jgi:tetratricopeptide (TPR) repeat protein
VAAGLLAAALTGCNKNATLPNEPNKALPADDKKPMPDVSKYFGSKDSQVVGAPGMQPLPANPKKKASDPLKPETEVALADTEVESAFAEGRTSVEKDQLLDSARQRYQRAIKANSKYQDAHLGLARLYTLSGDRERAIETYKTALKAFPKDHGLAHRMAGAQVKFGDWPGAIETCKVALSLDPENRTYQKTLGFCLAQGGRMDEAYEVMSRLMTEPEVRYFLGRILYDHDKAAEARQMMEMALKADPQYVTAREFLTALDAGQAAPSPQGGIQTVGHQEPAAAAEGQ